MHQDDAQLDQKNTDALPKKIQPIFLHFQLDFIVYQFHTFQSVGVGDIAKEMADLSCARVAQLLGNNNNNNNHTTADGWDSFILKSLTL